MLTDTEHEILTKLIELTNEIANAPEPEAWRKRAWLEWEMARDFGPAFSVPRWFGLDGRIPEADRQRYLRATKGLEQRGLVLLHRGSGGRVERAQITNDGRAVMEAKP